MHAGSSGWRKKAMSEPNRQQESQSATRMSRFGFKKPRIFPPFWLAFAIITMLALDRWLPVVELTPSFTSGFAWLLLLPGLAITLIAASGFRRAKTGIVPFSQSTALVTGGIYRFTRNPMYLGMAVLLAGLALKLGSLGAWIPIPVLIAILQRQFVRNEEIFLTAIYGDAFRSYQENVRRWL
jgi:protein-S-isoprenylcysteine O-methyltransferase Ste14